MRFLHTSDWHLGRRLYGRRRENEFSAFLDWLINILDEKKIDVLLVAGDLFDTATPGTGAQELYYRFLYRVGNTGCRHIVITAGNHDSPSFLNAPGPLLKAMNIHVVGSADPQKEIIILNNQGDEQAVICAVPYLRDRDIRRIEMGESADDKTHKLLSGIEDHYKLILEEAREKRNELEQDSEKKIPLIVMGHLFTAGGKTTDDDGVRELYVGTLAHIGSEMFGEDTDYVALGHLHVPQLIGHDAYRRYSGSPLAMGFGEAGQKKCVVLFEMDSKGNKSQDIVFVPGFQLMEKVKGDLGEILTALEFLKMGSRSVWVEVEYTGQEGAGDLRTRLEEVVEGSVIEILRIKNLSKTKGILKKEGEEESLDDLSELLVFERCLDAYGKEGEERAELLRSYGEILDNLREGTAV